MKTKSLTVYATTNPGKRARDYSWITKNGITVLYMRIVLNKFDALTALERAKPRKNETLMNTLEIV